MKSAVNVSKLVLLLVIVVFSMSLASCSREDNVCCYAWFGDCALMFYYREDTNTLYEIKIPVSQIVRWGRYLSMESVPETMRSFTGMNEDCFIAGTPDTLSALRDILDALSGTGPGTEISRLQALSDRAELLKDREFTANISRLCQIDMGVYIDLLAKNSPRTVYFDAGNFLRETDAPEYARSYFVRWLSQITD